MSYNRRCPLFRGSVLLLLSLMYVMIIIGQQYAVNITETIAPNMTHISVE